MSRTSRIASKLLLVLACTAALIVWPIPAPASEAVSDPADGASAAELAAGCDLTSPVTEFPVVRCAWFKAANKVVFDPGPDVDPDWKLTASVNELEDRVPALGNLIVGNCANHPSAPCVRVYQVNQPSIDWWVRFQVLTSPDPNDGWIKFNVAGSSAGIARPAACHGTARIFGLSQNTSPTSQGCTYVDILGSIHVAPAALEALREGYR